jgi:phosphohistidine swiveling domain-containing protein
MLVEQLLEDCIEFGTLPFSVFARCAFIGNAFLKSLVSRGVMSPEELDQYLHSIQTVAGDFIDDIERYKAGAIELDAFLHRYGHLRPGTYDICAHTYAERPEIYLGSRTGTRLESAADPAGEPKHGFPAFPARALAPLARLIADYGFSFDVETLNRFIVTAIQLREGVKFEFTKNLSSALTLICDFGQYHGFTRDGLSFLPIENLLALANRNVSADWLEAARDIVERNRKRYDLTGAINLPDLIFSKADIEVISLQRRRPNFVTQKRVVAHSVRLEAASGIDAIPDLAGCLVLIENADPGFDWLFTRKIGGLITKYGGAASHMTIRCAELGLPAAIGCGEQIFEELAKSGSILLDCAERRVEPNAI